VILIDLKRGRGGIRELEFLVQTLQLLHGARDPAARNPAIVEVVEALARAGRLTPAEAKSIRQDYLFLRVVENRIQLLEARQTHALPKDAAALESLARRCGSDGAALLAQLSEVAGRVHRRFVERFGESAAQSPSAALRSPSARAAARLSEGAREAELIPLLAPFGLESPGAIACLKRLGGGGSVYLDEAARRRWGEIAPKLIEAAGASARPAQALARLESFLAAAGSMAGMYEIFGANPRVPELLLQAFGATDVWARTLTAHPEYLDYLLDARQLAEDPAKAALRERLDKWISTSGIMLHTPSAALARFRAFEYMMAGIAELAGLATYEEAVARLTRIAEAIIERALDWTVGDSKNYRGFSILAMGKLGASELHYASDLDLIFVYEGESGDWDEDRASGVATRLLETLTATTSEGRAFAADARLRPEGQNAPLAPARSRYLDYYRGRADLWELQSLMKLRPIAGDMQLGERLKSELIQIAADRIETMGAEDVTKRIVEMRRRIEEAARTPEWVLCDFKKGPGGSIDIEFIAQRIQLLHLRERPEWVGLAADRVIERALRPLVAQPPSAVIPGELALARELIADYLFLRRLESRARLLFETDRSQAPAGGEKWEALARAAADLTSPGARDLRDGLLQTLRRVRNRFDRIMGGDAR
jgi:glutamate-ammonia-ligase adenylyltransferase